MVPSPRPEPDAMDTDCPMTERPPKEMINAVSAVLRPMLMLQIPIMFAPTVISMIPFAKADHASPGSSRKTPRLSISSMAIIKRIRYAKITAIALNPAIIDAVKLSI